MKLNRPRNTVDSLLLNQATTPIQKTKEQNKNLNYNTNPTCQRGAWGVTRTERDHG